MAGKTYRGVGGAICAVAMAWTASAPAIETTYGEDPVPNSECTDDFIDLGYGVDPIPAKSPYVRWQEWRAARGLAPTVGPFKRQQGQSRFLNQGVQPRFAPQSAPSSATAPAPARGFQNLSSQHSVGAAAGSKRNARTKNLTSGSSVR